VEAALASIDEQLAVLWGTAIRVQERLWVDLATRTATAAAPLHSSLDPDRGRLLANSALGAGQCLRLFDSTLRCPASFGGAVASVGQASVEVVRSVITGNTVECVNTWGSGCRVHGAGAADGVRSHFRQADMAHIARFHHIADGANRVLDRHFGIKPCG
jgi:hypothetical protein